MQVTIYNFIYFTTISLGKNNTSLHLFFHYFGNCCDDVIYRYIVFSPQKKQIHIGTSASTFLSSASLSTSFIRLSEDLRRVKELIETPKLYEYKSSLISQYNDKSLFLLQLKLNFHKLLTRLLIMQITTQVLFVSLQKNTILFSKNIEMSIV